MTTRSLTDITGNTKVLAILADPIAHVKAPPGINRIAIARGRDAVMVPFQVAPEKLATLIEGLRALKSFDGAVVTVPHKGAVAGHCDVISDRARAMGAVNVLRREDDGRLVGDMLDGAGFLAGLAAAGIGVAGKRVYLVGAGGAASAIAFAVAEAGAAHLTLANRTRAKAEDLCARILAAYPGASVSVGDADPSGHDIVINGTSLGMRASDSLPLDAERLAPPMVVAEVIMVPEITPLLAAAREKGCRIHLGKPMLDHQLELMADFLKL
ncbi:shikimate dehydrogenase [Enterovirga sp.]|uniref:shikimate dehydrogenase family protein n=1 Tax=Enterovirga sp. TaxID=2026350 RepID=UPI002C33D2CB|nr:shikimate dehydrogenase [Enterovirga sp.]HMO30871.1 shikimate dehydrogenase [Enterovirga sp.]